LNFAIPERNSKPCPECNKILRYRTTSHGWYCGKCDCFYPYEAVKMKLVDMDDYLNQEIDRITCSVK